MSTAFNQVSTTNLQFPQANNLANKSNPLAKKPTNTTKPPTSPNPNSPKQALEPIETTPTTELGTELATESPNLATSTSNHPTDHNANHTTNNDDNDDNDGNYEPRGSLNLLKEQSNRQPQVEQSQTRRFLSQEPRIDRERARNPSVTITYDTINKREVRVFLELVKGCFSKRLSDPVIINAILTVALVEEKELAKAFCTDFASPIYLPEEDEPLETTLARVASIHSSSIIANSASTLSLSTNQINNNNQQNQQSFNTQRVSNTGLRVPILATTRRLLIGYQRDLTSYLLYPPDLNALADKVLDIGKYTARGVITEIIHHYQGLKDLSANY